MCPLHQDSPACCSYSVLRKDKYKFNLKQHLEQEAKKHGRTLPSGVSCAAAKLGRWYNQALHFQLVSSLC